MEADRGNNIRWVKPTAGYVLKTEYEKPPNPDGVPDDVSKVFINVCSSVEIAEASAQNRTVRDGKSGESWSIPYSLVAGRIDVDHGN